MGRKTSNQTNKQKLFDINVISHEVSGKYQFFLKKTDFLSFVSMVTAQDSGILLSANGYK